MPYRQLQENWEKFSALMSELQPTDAEHSALIKRYLEQNVSIINDVLTISIENMQKLQCAATANDIICMQASFTNEVSKRLSRSAQRFLNASLSHIADYNEWLKAHCDLATD